MPAVELVRVQRKLAGEVDRLRFTEPVAFVYNPLVYARRSAEAYARKFARPSVEVLLLGMNPGPFGMAQTGVPFGEVGLVREWLGIEERVERPAREHPKRPILGFASSRSEVSGRRLWGWARERFATPERFFARFFVWNYCPLAFLETSGRNRTPDKLSPSERAALYAICDASLREVVATLEPRHVIGIGGFARRRAEDALADLDLPVGEILHPSPASPIANRGWAPQAERQLKAMGVRLGP